MSVIFKYITGSKYYFIGNDGWFYRKVNGKMKLLKGWINITKKRYQPYRRCWIAYKDRERKQEYNHMMVAIYFHGGDRRKEGMLVRHGESGATDNSEGNVSWGTHHQNQVEDRKRDGNYNNRGKKKPVNKEFDDVPF